jgi:hypothetical protein
MMLTERGCRVNVSKTEVAEYLAGLGNDARVIDGVVVILTDAPMPHRKKEQIRNALRAIRYAGSWGWRMRSNDIG